MCRVVLCVLCCVVVVLYGNVSVLVWFITLAYAVLSNPTVTLSISRYNAIA